MKRLMIPALMLGLIVAPVGLSGCAEKSEVKEEVKTPGGSTTTSTTVEKTGTHKDNATTTNP